jgi:hypothetical protein
MFCLYHPHKLMVVSAGATTAGLTYAEDAELGRTAMSAVKLS